MNQPLTAFLLVTSAYLLGSLPFALLLGKTRGVDIREIGSGNPGATNLGRALGKRWAVAAFLCDFAKGFLPVLATPWILPDEPRLAWIELAVGAAAVLGHVYPLWLRFRGGKGVATCFGVMSALVPIASLLSGLVWYAVFRKSRTVSLASVAAGLVLPVFVAVSVALRHLPRASATSRIILAVVLAVLVLWRHRSNLARLLRGREHRFEKPETQSSTSSEGSLSTDDPETGENRP